MDEFLSRLGIQAVNYAMRCGIALTSTFALQQCSRLLKTVDNKAQRDELQALQKILDNKIKIVSPALDLIEFRSGRGNVFLGNAVTLAKALHRDIAALGKRIENAAATEEASRASNRQQMTTEKRQTELLGIIRDINILLVRIDSDIPLIQLAITASGESLSTSFPPSISPSRLLQASMFLTLGDTHFANKPCRPMQIGPSFILSLYMLFQGHADTANSHQGQPYGLGESERKPIWQEVLHKSRVRICRTPFHWEFDHETGYQQKQEHSTETRNMARLRTDIIPYWNADEYTYHLEIIENLDDGRAHDDEEEKKPSLYDGIDLAGIRESIPIHQISKIFYTDTGRMLNIGGTKDYDTNPVLLLKRDLTATVPNNDKEHMPSSTDEENLPQDSPCTQPDEQEDIDRQLQDESEAFVANTHANTPSHNRQYHYRRFPHHLDPEWLAMEVFVEDDEEDEESVSDAEENGDIVTGTPKTTTADSRLVDPIRNLSVSESARADTLSNSGSPPPGSNLAEDILKSHVGKSPFGAVMSSLSLLEMLIRLTSLQEFQQTSHLSIPDHILTFFLEETSTTGLRGEERWKMKNNAKQRVGFDPYTDAP